MNSEQLCSEKRLEAKLTQAGALTSTLAGGPCWWEPCVVAHTPHSSATTLVSETGGNTQKPESEQALQVSKKNEEFEKNSCLAVELFCGA